MYELIYLHGAARRGAPPHPPRENRWGGCRQISGATVSASSATLCPTRTVLPCNIDGRICGTCGPYDDEDVVQPRRHRHPVHNVKTRQGSCPASPLLVRSSPEPSLSRRRQTPECQGDQPLLCRINHVATVLVAVRTVRTTWRRRRTFSVPPPPRGPHQSSTRRNSF